jgi:hypothetical protein
MAEGDEAPALPPRVGPAAAATGLTCPGCGGSLTVRAEGRADFLHAETLRRVTESNRALVLRTGEERVPAC